VRAGKPLMVVRFGKDRTGRALNLVVNARDAIADGRPGHGCGSEVDVDVRRAGLIALGEGKAGRSPVRVLRIPHGDRRQTRAKTVRARLYHQRTGQSTG